MSFEWTRARALQNQWRERQRAQLIQGPDAPEVEMLYPIEVTFWGQSAPIELRCAPQENPRHLEKALRQGAADPNHIRRQGNEST